jgi:hypothetical protein
MSLGSGLGNSPRLVIALDDEIDLAQVHAFIFAEDVGHLTIDLE